MFFNLDALRVEPVRKFCKTRCINVFEMNLLSVALLEISVESRCEICRIVADEGFVDGKCRFFPSPPSLSLSPFLGRPCDLLEVTFGSNGVVTYERVGFSFGVSIFWRGCGRDAILKVIELLA